MRQNRLPTASIESACDGFKMAWMVRSPTTRPTDPHEGHAVWVVACLLGTTQQSLTS
ncbi:MAG: hypothetical protein NVS2B9_00940 [Myxococcales bacterium]